MGKADLTDDVLGVLRYDRELGWYEGEWSSATGPIRIKVVADGDGRVEDALIHARRVVADMATFAAAAADHAVDKLLNLKNENWLDEEEGPVTPEEFRQRMRLDGIIFDPSGEVTFYHDDRDLFWGHAIEVGMDADGNFHHADLPG